MGISLPVCVGGEMPRHKDIPTFTSFLAINTPNVDNFFPHYPSFSSIIAFFISHLSIVTSPSNSTILFCNSPTIPG